MTLVLLLGGARSGKSALAVRMAERQEAAVVFVATAEALDEEMRERIERHRRERPDGWQVVEEPLELEAALAAAPAESCVIVDCLTLWVSNLLEPHSAEVEELATAAAAAAASRAGLTIAV